MNQPIKILVLEEKLTDIAFIQNVLNKSEMKFEIKAVHNKVDFNKELDNYNADVILANHICKHFHSTEALEIIKTKQLAIPFILVTDSVNEEFAVSIIKLGADDYIVKNNLSRLASAIETAIKLNQQEKDISSDNIEKSVHKKRLQLQLAEEKLKQSEALTSAIFNSRVIGFFYFDANGEIIDANEYFLETFGYTRQDLLDGKLHWGRMTPPEYVDRDQLAIKELAETGLCLPFEKAFISKDGIKIPIQIGGGMILEENTTKGYAYVINISERLKAEEKLQYTLRKLEEAQEISKLGYWEFDMISLERIWSQQVFKNYNFPVTSELPTTEQIVQHTHPEDRSVVNIAVEKAWKGIQTENFIIRTNPEFGPLKYLLNIWQLIYNEAGEAIKLLGTVQDVTNDKEVELKLIEQNEALKKANTELDRFVYSASHDLRAPLKSMLGLTDLFQIELNSDDSEHGMLLDMIKKSIYKLDDFIEDILDYSRNARIEFHLEDMNFEEIIEEIRGNHKFMDGANDVVLKLDIHLESAFISDISRMKIILNNLISNAVKYHNNKNNDSFVLIKIRCDKTMALIEVIDNGIGVAQKDHENIFKMFHRASTLSTGSGLGLYIVNEAIEKLGGTIKLESELGKGSTFLLSIPNNI